MIDTSHVHITDRKENVREDVNGCQRIVVVHVVGVTYLYPDYVLVLRDSRECNDYLHVYFFIFNNIDYCISHDYGFVLINCQFLYSFNDEFVLLKNFFH